MEAEAQKCRLWSVLFLGSCWLFSLLLALFYCLDFFLCFLDFSLFLAKVMISASQRLKMPLSVVFENSFIQAVVTHHKDHSLAFVLRYGAPAWLCHEGFFTLKWKVLWKLGCFYFTGGCSLSTRQIFAPLSAPEAACSCCTPAALLAALLVKAWPWTSSLPGGQLESWAVSISSADEFCILWS